MAKLRRAAVLICLSIQRHTDMHSSFAEPVEPHRILIGCAGWNIPSATQEHFLQCGSHLDRKLGCLLVQLPLRAGLMLMHVLDSRYGACSTIRQAVLQYRMRWRCFNGWE
ncbi:MAG TPA: hypothetical protein VF427_11990 [Noviherbaspirillum sp.]